jgi:hypothetical protein
MKHVPSQTKFLLLCGLLAPLALSGCGGGGTNVTALSSRLYAAGDAVPSTAIAYFTSPFTALSTPTSTFVTPPGGEVIGLAIDGSGDVITSDQFLKTVTGYMRPSPATASLFTVTTSFTPAGIAFDSQGKLYVADYDNGGGVDVIASPFTNSSTVTPLITGLNATDGLCFDTSQNLYTVAYGAASTIRVYAAPYTAASVTVATGNNNVEDCAINPAANQLAVNVVGAFSGKVLIYNLPLTNTSVPAVTLTYSSSSSTAVAFDTSGRLYVGVGASAIQVYQPPFSSASTPLFSIPTANAVNAMVFGS